MIRLANTLAPTFVAVETFDYAPRCSGEVFKADCLLETNHIVLHQLIYVSHLKLTRVTWSKCEVKRILYECCFWYSTIPNKSTYFPYKCQDQEWKYSNWESFEGWFDWWWDPAVQIFAPISLAETLNQPKIDENFRI